MKVDVLPGLAGLDEAPGTGCSIAPRQPSVFLTWQWQTEWARAFARRAAPADPGRATAPTAASPASCRSTRTTPERAAHRRRRRRLRLSRPDRARGRRGGRLAGPAAAPRRRSGVEWDLHARPGGLAHGRDPARGSRRPAGCARDVEVEERCPVLALPADVGRVPRAAVRQGSPRAQAQDAQARARAARRDRALARGGRGMGRRARPIPRRCTGSPRSARRASWTSAWSASSATPPRALAAARLGAAVVSRVRGRRRWRAFSASSTAGSVGLYNSGFDPAHAELAPGIVLLAHVIRDAIERGVPVFDFLRGEEPYKYGLRARRREDALPRPDRRP